MLYGVSSNNGATAQLWRVKPGASEREQIATAPDPFNIRASPDGRWIMYTSLVSGRSEVFVQGYPSGPQRQITSDGGVAAEWRADGRELYYLTDGGTKLNAAPIATSRGLEVGAPVVLFELPPRSAYYAPAPDGTAFYVALHQPPTRPEALMVLVNWLGR